jgi:V/A-type H+-transporting ATPase subunit D
VSAAVRHPPGRSGRLWLRRRLVAATRGAELLDRKLRILRREEQRFTALAERTRAEWETACAAAETWALRAVVVAGEGALLPEPDGGAASVDVTWAAVMGVRYPAGATCRVPDGEDDRFTGRTAARAPARDAYRTALRAGVAHAAAVAAVRVVEAEIAATRGRLRAIEDRWVPRLDEALAGVEAALQEEEAGDGVRLRWSARVAATHAGAAGEPGTGR